jgi:hypothetical protein
VREDRALSEASTEARELLTEMGYDPTSFWEQPIVWGDHDSFQCVPPLNMRMRVELLPCPRSFPDMLIMSDMVRNEPTSLTYTLSVIGLTAFASSVLRICTLQALPGTAFPKLTNLSYRDGCSG